jgi:hypothetical protein
MGIVLTMCTTEGPLVGALFGWPQFCLPVGISEPMHMLARYSSHTTGTAVRAGWNVATWRKLGGHHATTELYCRYVQA